MADDNKCSYTLVFKVIFISLFLSKLSILIFLQYPSPVADSSFFLSVSKFHCTDGIFRTPIFPLEEIGALYLWHSIMQPLIISLLSFNCSVQSFYIGLSFLIISTIFLIFLLKIKSREDKFFWIFSMIVFALQAKQGFRNEIISIFIIISTLLFAVLGNPVKILVTVGALNGLILPIALAVILIAARHKKIVGNYKQPLWLDIAGWLVVAVMTTLSILTIKDWIAGLL